MNPSSLKEHEIAASVGLDWTDRQHRSCLPTAADSSLEFATIQQQPEVPPSLPAIFTLENPVTVSAIFRYNLAVLKSQHLVGVLHLTGCLA